MLNEEEMKNVDVQGVDHLVDTQYEDDDEGESISPVGAGYSSISSVNAVVDQSTNSVSVVENKPKTVFDVMKLQADAMGFMIRDPKKNCNKCYGRGYVSMDSKTKQPIPCKCIFPPLTHEEKLKNDDMANKISMTNMNRESKRRMEKTFRKNGARIIRELEKNKPQEVNVDE